MSKGLSNQQRIIYRLIGSNTDSLKVTSTSDLFPFFAPITDSKHKSILRALQSLEKHGLIHSAGYSSNHELRWWAGKSEREKPKLPLLFAAYKKDNQIIYRRLSTSGTDSGWAIELITKPGFYRFFKSLKNAEAALNVRWAGAKVLGSELKTEEELGWLKKPREAQVHSST